MKRLLLFFMLAFLIVLGSTTMLLAQNSQEQAEETYILVFDEAHYQYFTADLMSTALGSLNDSLDTDLIDVTIELVIQTEAFNSTNVQGADLIMITNPGLNEDGDLAEIETGEDDALLNLINIGGSVLWMSNPLSNNPNITGHADPLNNLLISGFGADINTEPGDPDNTTVIKDEINFEVNNTFVELNAKNFNDETIVTQINDISVKRGASFLMYAAQVLEVNLPGEISANSSITSYVYQQSYDIIEYQDAPHWIFGRDLDDEAAGEDSKGRGMLIGSTIMFSDYQFDDSSTWIQKRNNLELFQNLIAWLLNLTPLPEGINLVTEPFSFFVGLNILYGVGISAVVAFVVIGRYMYQGRLKPTELMNIFTKDKSKTKETASSTKRKTNSATKAKTKRRKRT